METDDVSPVWPVAGFQGREIVPALPTRAVPEDVGGTFSSAQDVRNLLHEDPQIEVQDLHHFAEQFEQLAKGDDEHCGDCVSEFRDIAWTRAAELRYQASLCTDATQSDALLGISRVFEMETSTWSLVLHALCKKGSGVEIKKQKQQRPLTARQEIARIANADMDLFLCAVVAGWLEEQSALILDRDLEDGTVIDKLKESDMQLMETMANGSARELDPDGPSRTERQLSVGDEEDQDKVLLYVWKLIRAGRLENAQDVCTGCGQPWRAALLAGCGPSGPLPLDTGVQDMDVVEGTQEATFVREELASKFDGQEASSQALWKWSCYKTAHRAQEDVRMSGVSYESAICASMCGDVKLMLPACQTWEDVLWAYCKCYVALHAERKWANAKENSPAKESDNLDELLASFVDPQQNARNGNDMETSMDALKEGHAVSHGAWPPERLLSELPSELWEVFSILDNFDNKTIQEECEDPFRVIQRGLLQGRFDTVLQEHLSDYVQEAAEKLASGNLKAEEGIVELGMMRFCTHLALILLRLGLIKETMEENESVFRGIIQAYLGTLKDLCCHHIVPMYACHSDPESKEKAFHDALEKLQDETEEDKQHWYKMACEWTDKWVGENASLWHLPVHPERNILHEFVVQHCVNCRESPKNGLKQRVDSCVWLWTGGAVHNAMGTGHKFQYDLSIVLNFFRDFSLGGPDCSGFGRELARTVPEIIYSLSPSVMTVERMEGVKEVEEILFERLQDELRKWKEFYTLEHRLMEWKEEVESLDLAIDRATVVSAQSVSEEVWNSVGEAGVQLFNEVLDRLVLDDWVKESDEDVDITPQFVVPVKLGSGVDVENGTYVPFPPNKINTMKTALEEWGRRMYAECRINVTCVVPQENEGYFQLVFSGARERTRILISELVSLAKGNAEGVGPIAIISLENDLYIAKAVCRRVCLGRIVLSLAQMYANLKLLGCDPGREKHFCELVAENREVKWECLSDSEIQQILECEMNAKIADFVRWK